MLVLPLALAIFFARRLGANWRLWGWGALTFVLSQVGHIPFNLVADRWLKSIFDFAAWPPDAALAFSAVFLGMSAGLWEELARYAMFRWAARDARSWRTALWTGAGHGGIESALMGLSALVAFFQLSALRGQDLSTVVPPEQLTLAQAQVAAYWSASWYQPLLGTLERVFAMTIQLSLAVLVVQVFRRGERRWLWLAIGYHALVDALAVFLVAKIGLWVEAVIAGLALFSLWLIFRLRDDDAARPQSAAADVSPPPADLLRPAPIDEEKLDETRFHS